MQNAKNVLQPYSLVNLDTEQECSAKHFRASVLQETHQKDSMRAVPLQKGSLKSMHRHLCITQMHPVHERFCAQKTVLQTFSESAFIM